ncbi:MAG: hypothetical protein ACJAX8_001266, partial [Flavobacteriales bacterium]
TEDAFNKIQGFEKRKIPILQLLMPFELRR